MYSQQNLPPKQISVSESFPQIYVSRSPSGESDSKSWISGFCGMSKIWDFRRPKIRDLGLFPKVPKTNRPFRAANELIFRSRFAPAPSGPDFLCGLAPSGPMCQNRTRAKFRIFGHGPIIGHGPALFIRCGPGLFVQCGPFGSNVAGPTAGPVLGHRAL